MAPQRHLLPSSSPPHPRRSIHTPWKLDAFPLPPRRSARAQATHRTSTRGISLLGEDDAHRAGSLSPTTLPLRARLYNLRPDPLFARPVQRGDYLRSFSPALIATPFFSSSRPDHPRTAAMPTMTVLSPAMRRLRRQGIEIRQRMTTALAPTGAIAKKKKPSPPPPYASVLALPAPLPRSIPAPTATRPPSPPSEPNPAEVAVVKSTRIGKGAQVRVRTRVGTAACTGQPIVLWLRAVVDGNGKLPRVARVAPSDVRMHHDDVPHAADAAEGGAASSGGSCSAVTSDDDGSARRPPQQSKAAPRPRPTVAGKKLPLLRKFEKEMKSKSKAILSGW
ncbi:hypothetical protein HU200_051365 [Digitaria exilis]|uniref:Uncharacterized protein n=1 Tax=Digitaria exilis TaxID=1010633 RepID=A0A835AT96_9POAL|nr:hypothetical protein HU200_051365 [Digitaria exilis]